MRRTLTGLAGLGAALALLATACGGASNTSASGGSTTAGAAVTPASAPIYVSIDTDLSSGQWQSVDKLLDAFKQQADTGVIGDAAAFKDALGSLSGDALVTAYANGPKVTAALQTAFPSAGATATSQGKLVWRIAELAAENDGVRLDGKFKAEGIKTQIKPYKSALLDEVPAGVLLY